MALYLGDKTASVYLGTSTVTVPGAYLGGLQVFPTGPSVPGAPTITFAEEEGGGCGQLYWTPPASDGGSPVLYWRVYANGVLQNDEINNDPVTTMVGGCSFGLNAGNSLQMSGVNAVGEGQLSAPFTVTLLS